MASGFCDPLVSHTCDHCGNAAKDAIRCTVQDNKTLCQDCFQGLPEARREDIGDDEWVCHRHFNRKVEVFCNTCQCGSCKDCAGDVHKSHDVAGVLELAGEIRRELLEQLQEVRGRADELPRQRMEISNAIGKIEEARIFVNQLVKEIEDEIARKEQEEVLIINTKTDQMIMKLQMKRDRQIESVKERHRLDRQRIAEINHDMTTRLLKDEEPRKHKIGLRENNLLIKEQACEHLSKEINVLLESTPKELVHNGRQLCSLVKASSTFQSEEDVITCRSEVTSNLPSLEEKKNKFFYYGFRPFTPFMKFVLCILIIFFFASIAREDFRDKYISFLSCLSSESKTAIAGKLFYLALGFSQKCLWLIMLCYSTSTLDYPFKGKQSFRVGMRSLKETVFVALAFEVLTVLFLMLVVSPFYIFQWNTASENIISLISILQSCCFLCLMHVMQHSKMFKNFGYSLTDPLSY